MAAATDGGLEGFESELIKEHLMLKMQGADLPEDIKEEIIPLLRTLVAQGLSAEFYELEEFLVEPEPEPEEEEAVAAEGSDETLEEVADGSTEEAAATQTDEPTAEANEPEADEPVTESPVAEEHTTEEPVTE